MQLTNQRLENNMKLRSSRTMKIIGNIIILDKYKILFSYIPFSTTIEAKIIILSCENYTICKKTIKSDNHSGRYRLI